jgi:nucleoside phosphorylase
MTRPHFRTEDYTVGWICALPMELAAAAEMLDEEHQDLHQDAHDPNVYMLGRIDEHNVVIPCLLAGHMGTNSAAAVASQIASKFWSIRFSLMVGIGGAVPSVKSDIRLGHIVVSKPHMQHGGVVQYDFGKTGGSGHSTQMGSLGKPPIILMNTLSKLQANQIQGKSNLSTYLSSICHLLYFSCMRAGPDILFESTYNHIEGQTCDRCSRDGTVERISRGSQEVVVYYGTIASGN